MVVAEVRMLLTALQFLTRLPVPRTLNPTPSELSGSIKYFPVVGCILGVFIACCAYALEFYHNSPQLTTLCTITVALLLTGAFHEDGLADSMDGLGGAFEPAKKLEIMKDSRIGTYGGIGLMLILLFRLELWQHPAKLLLLFLPISLMWARYSSLILVKILNYVSTGSHNKPMITAIRQSELLIASLCTLVITLSLLGPKVTLEILVLNAFILFVSQRFLKKQVGGYTGDLLGAVNIVIELFTMYLLGRSI
jgi:adenosylcobinamide-GDP ribazoletransferase